MLQVQVVATVALTSWQRLLLKRGKPVDSFARLVRLQLDLAGGPVVLVAWRQSVAAFTDGQKTGLSCFETGLAGVKTGLTALKTCLTGLRGAALEGCRRRFFAARCRTLDRSKRLKDRRRFRSSTSRVGVSSSIFVLMLMLSLWLLLLMMMVGHFLLLDELEFEFGVVFFDVWTDAGRLQR